MSTSIMRQNASGPTVLLPDIRIRPERELFFSRAQASIVREQGEPTAPIAPGSPTTRADTPSSNTARRELSSFIHGQPRTRKRSQVLGVGDGFTAFHVAQHPSPPHGNGTDEAGQTDRLDRIPPHLATIARYLQGAFVDRSVSALTQSGRFQGILRSVSGDGIGLDGADGVRRVLPLAAILSVAPS